MIPTPGEPPHDLERYRPHVRRFGLSEDAEMALLIAVRDIMSSFVERNFQDDPIHHVQRGPTALDAKNALAEKDVIDSRPVEKTTNSLAGAFTPTVAPGPQKEE